MIPTGLRCTFNQHGAGFCFCLIIIAKLEDDKKVRLGSHWMKHPMVDSQF